MLPASMAMTTRGGTMPKVSKQTASSTEHAPGFEGHFEDLGGYTVAFETYSEDTDLATLFIGLPDDRCQCPHWCVVLKGKVTFHYGERAETIEAGEAYFAPPGHTPELHAGTEVVEFSPTAELARTLEVVKANVENAEAHN
jgi:mannose-6-phosphate isomerase-like protein (cupin superfamily)